MTGTHLIDVTLERLGDSPTAAPGQAHYGRGETLVAINKVYNLMVFLTLCLETNTTFTWTGGAVTLQMLGLFADWILPLRLRVPTGAKIKPDTFASLASLNEQWSKQTGTPERYALAGFGLIGTYPHVAADTIFGVAYARNAAPLTDSAAEPELQGEYHPALIDGAITLLRIKEGAQEWQKTLPNWSRFMEATGKLNQYMRARNKERGYDYLPPDLTRFDKSKILKGVLKNG